MNTNQILGALTIERMEEFFVVLRTEESLRIFGIATNFKAAKKLLAAIRRNPAHYGI